MSINYDKHSWAYGEEITPDKLNNVENGIKANADAINEVNNNLTKITKVDVIYNSDKIAVGTYRAGEKRLSIDVRNYSKLIFDLGSTGLTGVNSREFTSLDCAWIAFVNDGYYCVNTSSGLITMYISVTNKCIDLYNVPKEIHAITAIKDKK